MFSLRFSSLLRRSLYTMSHFSAVTSGATLPRVLSIQSTVSFGYVGNKAATFPLQCLGFHVDSINTVSLSNHPSYAGGFKGQFLSAEDMQNTVAGLQNNDLLKGVECVLTGYTRSVGVLEQIESTVRTVKESNPEALYICDPVLGDNGSFYVPEELVAFYKTRLLPLAFAATPNYFETEALTGIRVDSVADAVSACEVLHAMGPQVLLLKGLRLSPQDQKETCPLSVLLSYRVPGRPALLLRADVDRVGGSYSGCGDLFSALSTAGLHRAQKQLTELEKQSAPAPLSATAVSGLLGALLENVLGAMSAVVAATKAGGGCELHIIESIDVYRVVAETWARPSMGATMHDAHIRPTAPALPRPPVFLQASLSSVTGVIFDMDGTLTEPGAIDFAAMYTRNGLRRQDGDMLAQIARIEDPARRQAAMDVIIDEEMLGCERMRLRPGLAALLSEIKAARIRVAISTRNCRKAVDHFQQLAGLEQCEHIVPVITRGCLGGINTPDPRVAVHILEQWQLLPAHKETVWFVGDSEDDVLCGKGAGLKTCLLRTDYNRKFAEANPGVVDVQVDSLEEFAREVLGLQLRL